MTGSGIGTTRHNSFSSASASAAAAAVILSFVITALTLHLWHLRIDVPLAPMSDGISYAMLVKTVMETGWFGSNPALAAPVGAVFLDYPSADGVSLLLIKLLALFTQNYGTVVNLFYLASFPLTTLVSLYVLRRLGLDVISATGAALLYTFIPYHFLRGEIHLFLSSYYSIPLAALIAVELAAPALAIGAGATAAHRTGPIIGSRALTAFACIVLGSSGFYYAAFAMFLMVAAGSIAAVSERDWHRLTRACGWAAVVFGAVLVNMLPSLSYWTHWGRNVAIARPPEGVELYGLKIAHLVLPVSGHRIAALAALKDKYVAVTPLNNENLWASLGLVGTTGFLASIVLVVCLRNARRAVAWQVDTAARLTLAAVLLATIGGFSTLIGILVAADIRAYNRISIVIAFLSLFVVFALAQAASERFGRRTPTIAYAILVAVIVAGGILDQTTPAFVPDYKDADSSFSSDSRFVHTIETRLPKAAMIYQMPYHAFPETGSVNRMGDYDLFRGYLYSNSLRWSYGAMKGRAADAWQSEIARRPLPRQLDAIVLAGFSGLYIDGFGYVDSGKQIEARLAEILNEQPIRSDDRRLLFFDLRPYGERLRGSMADSEWRRQAEVTLFPLRVSVTWSHGYSVPETDGHIDWRWSDRQGVMLLMNTTNDRQSVRLQMRVQPGDSGSHALRITGDLLSKTFEADERGIGVDELLSIDPGRHVVRIETDAPQLMAPGDPRALYFRVIDFSLSPAGGSSLPPNRVPQRP
jgi:hypothetical protein